MWFKGPSKLLVLSGRVGQSLAASTRLPGQQIGAGGGIRTVVEESGGYQVRRSAAEPLYPLDWEY
jgi:hypothetical protein